MKIKMQTMAILVLVIFFGGIAITIALDVWTTTTDKIPVQFTEGEFEGEYNPEDIRGSYTFDDVAKIFDIEITDLFKAFGISEQTDATQIKTKDLEVIYSEETVEIGNESVKVFVALYKNLPVVLDEVYLPKQAVDILLAVNKELTQEQITYLNDHQLVLDTAVNEIVIGHEEEESEDEVQLVNGTTTFQMILDQGIDQWQIEEVLGQTMPVTNRLVKDFCEEEGLSFTLIKDELNELLE